MKDETTATNAPEAAALTMQKLRELIAMLPDYALLTAIPDVVKGDECLMMRKNEFMPPGCQYLLIVAPDRLDAVIKRFAARRSSRMGSGNFYEFYVDKVTPPRVFPMFNLFDVNVT